MKYQKSIFASLILACLFFATSSVIAEPVPVQDPSYAAAGRFDEAVQTADRALSRAGDQPALAAEIRQRRSLYATGRPYLAPLTPRDGGPGGNAGPGLR